MLIESLEQLLLFRDLFLNRLHALAVTQNIGVHQIVLKLLDSSLANEYLVLNVHDLSIGKTPFLGFGNSLGRAIKIRLAFILRGLFFLSGIVRLLLFQTMLPEIFFTRSSRPLRSFRVSLHGNPRVPGKTRTRPGSTTKRCVAT